MVTGAAGNDSAETGGKAPAGEWLRGRTVTFVGRLQGMGRREARRMVREAGGAVRDGYSADVDLIVVGADHGGPGGFDSILDDAVLARAGEGGLEIVPETQWLQRLGLVDDDSFARRLYTPAMLADLLHVPVATVRRWHRRGLIHPVHQVHRLPYFDFSEVASARMLARLVAAGHSPQGLETKLAWLAERFPEWSRPLVQLPLIVEGREILLRKEQGLVDQDGQMRIDFELLDESAGEPILTVPARLSTADAGAGKADGESGESGPRTPAEFLALAGELEDEGRGREAAEAVRSLLLAHGPSAEAAFRLAELLYAAGELAAARERYSQAVELDGGFVEARASLGCVLLELGEQEQAIAAFRGALAVHADYADVHYHLARALDALDLPVEAEQHWQAFLRLAPQSPWAGMARQRLGLYSVSGADDAD